MAATLSHHTPITSSENGCPYHRRAAERPDHNLPAVEQTADGAWIVRGFREARQVLRAETVRQAGFMAEVAMNNSVLTRPPVLFMEGEEHQSMRRETGKFFTPTAVDNNYREMIDTLSDTLVARLVAKGRLDLSSLTMELAVTVASRILGLTDSRMRGLSWRLESLLNNSASLTKSGLALAIGTVKVQASLLSFYWFDVKPSLSNRRKAPQHDVFSYLISLGYTDLEMLTEAIVYGVAGMATTREFIGAALWHILERPELREIMLHGEEAERYALLGEILRLEPVVGDLYRRMTDDTTIETETGAVTIPKGAKVQISIVTSNADERVTGENPHTVCPGRTMTEMRPKVPDYMLSFGDGDHRCPGVFVALRETDIFIRKLLAFPTLRLEKAPHREFNGLIRGYELRKMIVSV